MGMKRMLATLAATAVLWGCGGAHPPREGGRRYFLPPPVAYKYKEVNGRGIFYRESGDPRKDLPDAELHLLDAGHFAAEERTREIAGLILEFLGKNGIE